MKNTLSTLGRMVLVLIAAITLTVPSNLRKTIYS